MFDGVIDPAELKRAKNRERMRKYRAANPESGREVSRKYRLANLEKCRERNRMWRPANKGKTLVSNARKRAKESGIEFSITVANIIWPTYCPVLGIELNYEGGKGANQPDSPSLDRWDNTKGYTPDNVRVISWRANCLKRDATWHELEAVAAYARYCGPPPAGLEEIWGW